MDNTTCIKNIYAISKNMGIKIGDLEESVELSKGYLARLKREGESFPAVDKLYLISKRLHVSMDALMCERISEMSPDEAVAFQFLDKLYNDSLKHNITWTKYRYSRGSDINEIGENAAVSEVYALIEKATNGIDNRFNDLDTIDLGIVYQEFIEEAIFYATYMPGTHMTIVASRALIGVNTDGDISSSNRFGVYLVGKEIENIPDDSEMLKEKINEVFYQIDSDTYVTGSLRNSMMSYLEYDFSPANE